MNGLIVSTRDLECEMFESLRRRPLALYDRLVRIAFVDVWPEGLSRSDDIR